MQTRACEHATVFTRKYLTLPREQFSFHIAEYFFVLFSFPLSSFRSQEPGRFSPIYFYREREPETCVAFEYVNEFLSMARCRSSRLTRASKIAISREGRKEIEASIRYFPAFLRKKITDTEIIDCGLETISISHDRY